MGISAISPDNETERFGLMLKGLLERPGIRFGNAIFNTVLLGMLRDGGFGARKEVREKLERITHRPHPHKNGLPSEPCAEMIRGRLQKCGTDLTQKLGYNREDAETVLAGAIAYYLDERFSITNRKLLGFK